MSPGATFPGSPIPDCQVCLLLLFVSRGPSRFHVVTVTVVPPGATKRRSTDPQNWLFGPVSSLRRSCLPEPRSLDRRSQIVRRLSSKATKTSSADPGSTEVDLPSAVFRMPFLDCTAANQFVALCMSSGALTKIRRCWSSCDFEVINIEETSLSPAVGEPAFLGLCCQSSVLSPAFLHLSLCRSIHNGRGGQRTCTALCKVDQSSGLPRGFSWAPRSAPRTTGAVGRRGFPTGGAAASMPVQAPPPHSWGSVAAAAAPNACCCCRGRAPPPEGGCHAPQCRALQQQQPQQRCHLPENGLPPHLHLVSAPPPPPVAAAVAAGASVIPAVVPAGAPAVPEESAEQVVARCVHEMALFLRPAAQGKTAILLRSPVTAQEHKIEGTTVEHTIVEIIPERKSQQSLYVTNVYSPPRDQLTDYDHFIRARVHDVAQQHGLTLWNDPLQPTRVGNSVSRDNNPDLTFMRDVKKAGWTCLPETLGSDHHIIQLDIGYERRPTKTGTARLTYWSAFRNELDDDEAIADIDAWLTEVLDTAQRAGRSTTDQSTRATEAHVDGRSVLARLGYGERYICEADRKVKVPPYLRDSLSIAQMPRA
ncbi:hypothetical protein HPB52_008813 [Rhipicephalus sanguineus]|uniref:Tick transposon n=1 Tax=Rhipicephalus sanguineus TaxID=34632 RepID=A0A9D4QJ94_RHISA|nr:hypothetical protein HPB52_008813 [Rhipicephalus sanguineus]